MLADLIQSAGGVANAALYFVISLSIIVAVHEYGHYIIGRWSGIKADVFSIGFGPRLLSRVDKHGTRWQVALIPLGGYVKFAGDGSAASSPDSDALSAMSPEEHRATMFGAPVWARAATAFAGPAFNFILSFVVFAALIFGRGVTEEPLRVNELRPMPAVNELMVGDRILAAEGREMPALEELSAFIDTLPNQRTLSYTVDREGAEIELQAPHLNPPRAAALSHLGAAGAAGVEKGDVIIAIDGIETETFEDLREIVGASEGRALELTIWRDGQELTLTMTPDKRDIPRSKEEGGGFETRWLIGITGGLFFEPGTERPAVTEALGFGVERTWGMITLTLSGVWHMVSGQISSCNVSGPVGIAMASSAMASEGLLSFLSFLAVMSTAIGLMNLFPIPVLDGGHLVFHAYEAVTGRPPNEGAMRILMTIGLAIVLSLMVFGLFNDFRC